MVAEEAALKAGGPVGRKAVGHEDAKPGYQALADRPHEVGVRDQVQIIVQAGAEAGEVVGEVAGHEDSGGAGGHLRARRDRDAGGIEVDARSIATGTGHAGAGASHDAGALFVDAVALSVGRAQG